MSLGRPRTTWQDIYAFDRSTSKMLHSVPESDAGSALTVYTYRNYPFDRSTNIAREWTALLASAIKIIEFCTLWISGDRTLCWVSNIAWLYFFGAALTVQFHRQWRGQSEGSGSDRVDILAGQLPTTTRPGGHRKLLWGNQTLEDCYRYGE